MISRTIVQLVVYGADPNASEVPCPPLFLAAYSNLSKIVHLLLQHGANPNLTLLADVSAAESPALKSLQIDSRLIVGRDHHNKLRAY